MARPVALQELQGPRGRLVDLLRTQGVQDLAVLRAFEMTPRHVFVPSGVRHRAYEDSALPIGSGQTISQPTVHGRSLQLLGLTGRERVLEIGTGSGYQTALLSHLVDQVFSVERVAALMDSARAALAELGVRNVSLLVGDGTVGWREYAPYDAILVSAASPEVPAPLVEQLAPHGRLLIPVGDREGQRLALITRTDDGYDREDLDPVRFVPLLGRHGWSP